MPTMPSKHSVTPCAVTWKRRGGWADEPEATKITHDMQRGGSFTPHSGLVLLGAVASDAWGFVVRLWPCVRLRLVGTLPTPCTRGMQWCMRGARDWRADVSAGSREALAGENWVARPRQGSGRKHGRVDRPHMGARWRLGGSD
eukprot:scaffold19617_cov127-Isochrysis_galbana.AAC.6